jgi:hypothetical protein
VAEEAAKYLSIFLQLQGEEYLPMYEITHISVGYLPMFLKKDFGQNLQLQFRISWFLGITSSIPAEETMKVLRLRQNHLLLPAILDDVWLPLPKGIPFIRYLSPSI